ncbi:hypothetical protein [Psychroserpens mesophilus]|uniref:hypothetical protein n=1 Tax=Psychroserpens mesophilus TaxID=325473 RepID=UPI00058DB852|nr:hypothetical protein [Psychroserpens mesophilus]
MKKVTKLKIKDITPDKHKCVIGACPTIIETNKDTYIIIGSIVESDILKKLSLEKKVGVNEIAIEVPKSLINIKS